MPDPYYDYALSPHLWDDYVPLAGPEPLPSPPVDYPLSRPAKAVAKLFEPLFHQVENVDEARAGIPYMSAPEGAGMAFGHWFDQTGKDIGTLTGPPGSQEWWDAAAREAPWAVPMLRGPWRGGIGEAAELGPRSPGWKSGIYDALDINDQLMRDWLTPHNQNVGPVDWNWYTPREGGRIPSGWYNKPDWITRGPPRIQFPPPYSSQHQVQPGEVAEHFGPPELPMRDRIMYEPGSWLDYRLDVPNVPYRTYEDLPYAPRPGTRPGGMTREELEREMGGPLTDEEWQAAQHAAANPDERLSDVPSLSIHEQMAGNPEWKQYWGNLSPREVEGSPGNSRLLHDLSSWLNYSPDFGDISKTPTFEDLPYRDRLPPRGPEFEGTPGWKKMMDDLLKAWGDTLKEYHTTQQPAPTIPKPPVQQAPELGQEKYWWEPPEMRGFLKDIHGLQKTPWTPEQLDAIEKLGLPPPPGVGPARMVQPTRPEFVGGELPDPELQMSPEYQEFWEWKLQNQQGDGQFGDMEFGPDINTGYTKFPYNPDLKHPTLPYEGPEPRLFPEKPNPLPTPPPGFDFGQFYQEGGVVKPEHYDSADYIGGAKYYYVDPRATGIPAPPGGDYAYNPMTPVLPPYNVIPASVAQPWTPEFRTIARDTGGEMPPYGMTHFPNKAFNPAVYTTGVVETDGDYYVVPGSRRETPEDKFYRTGRHYGAFDNLQDALIYELNFLTPKIQF